MDTESLEWQLDRIASALEVIANHLESDYFPVRQEYDPATGRNKTVAYHPVTKKKVD